MPYIDYQPRGYYGFADAALPETVRKLRRQIGKTQKSLKHNTLRLDVRDQEELAGVLVDFAVDVHHDIGIWRSYERYNTEFFGEPLPMTGVSEGSAPPDGIHRDRVLHLLWIIYPALEPGLLMAPSHQDMQRVADTVTRFLTREFSSIMSGSGVKDFLATPNEYGWEVKRKLIWLGTRSYMFRLFYREYLEDNDASEDDIRVTDDFICQQCTRWSGLGAIDVLADVLSISEERRRELRGWYERHFAAYKILSSRPETIRALNIINDRPYVIRMNAAADNPFRNGNVVYGNLVPWNGEWYWSGRQERFDTLPSEALEDAKGDFRRKFSRIVCRYDGEYERQLRDRMQGVHQQAMQYYGADLAVYPDGLSMAADWERELRTRLESKPQEEVKEVFERHGITSGKPHLGLPKELLDSEDGIGVFLNPEEGKEVMRGFSLVQSGLQRKGVGLTQDEAYAIEGFIDAQAVSPSFVKRVVADLGDEAIKSVYMLSNVDCDYTLDYLLRCYKGHFFRNRYPSVSLV